MVPTALESLIAEFGKLPGIGPRTAERLAYYVLKNPNAEAKSLARALSELHDSIQTCAVCYNLSEQSICKICDDSRRDDTVLAIVEEPLDIIALEKTHQFHGRYHVLGGVISPIEGMGPDQLNIKSLLERIDGKIEEIILALNPSTEGEATALFLQRKLPSNLKITRLARGLPMGSDLEYADQITLGRALEGRQTV